MLTPRAGWSNITSDSLSSYRPQAPQSSRRTLLTKPLTSMLVGVFL